MTVKITIEIENDEDIKKIRKAFKGDHITVVKTRKDKNKILQAVLKKRQEKLPKNVDSIESRYMPDRGYPDIKFSIILF